MGGNERPELLYGGKSEPIFQGVGWKQLTRSCHAPIGACQAQYAPLLAD